METRSYFLVNTTRPRTAKLHGGKHPIELRTSRSLDEGRIWIFTDGSGTGWYAAVIVRPGVEAHRITGYLETAIKNTGTELEAIVLGLENAERGEAVAIVSDYLWSAYYVNGWWRTHHAELREITSRIRLIFENQGLSDALFIHHAGHQKDSTEFSYWNNVADRLCRRQLLINQRMPMECNHEVNGQ
jgi:ribonuclease HI